MMIRREAAHKKTICPNFCQDCFALRVCPTHAIFEEPEAINVDIDLCIACASCKSICTALGYKALEKCRMKGL
jgi:Fe-S-cluster-containing hydrogenase component 2